MIRSMTGFGRGESTEEGRRITVEMKSVNHRYLDLNIKLPKKLSFFEASIRNVLKEYTERGKIDVFITFEDDGRAHYNLKYNPDIARAYYDYIQQMASEFSLENDLTVSRLSRYQEVFSLEEQDADEKELWADMEKALRAAAAEFVASREREGEHLRRDLTGKLEEMLAHVTYIEERAPEIIEEYRKRLTDRVKELLSDAAIEESRILTEVTIYADKICIDEEIVRLKSHIGSTLNVLKEGGSVGRKLDFIAQEMNREANTILSKANDLMTSDRAIELKTCIEKVREQIQNIE
ncbi:MAG: YicC family protein [Lachnospiraceae bacterium]|nr:YicC family protein [Lachnospiraceae bacterium]